jgi:hypothetical protein
VEDSENQRIGDDFIIKLEGFEHLHIDYDMSILDEYAISD